MNKSIVWLVVASLLLCGCGSNMLKGGAIGAGIGGLVGGIVGRQSDNTLEGAIIGAAVGGTAGTLIGRYMDRQAAEMQRDLSGAKIERVGEGIKITFDSGILFPVNSYQLEPDARTNVEKLAEILNRYPDTNILIEGHTDSDGSDAYNQMLSEQRAQSVGDFLKTRGITGARLTTLGYGESQPVADNDSDAGKSLNRRVEVAVFANEQLKEAAEQGRDL